MLFRLSEVNALPKDIQHLRKVVLAKLPEVRTNVYVEETPGHLKKEPNLVSIPRHLLANPNVKRVESFLSVSQVLKHVNLLHPGIFDQGARANLSSDGVPLSKTGSNTLRV